MVYFVFHLVVWEVYSIIKSDILLGAFNNNIAAMIVISFISGFNEDLPLKLISKISKAISD